MNFKRTDWYTGQWLPVSLSSKINISLNDSLTVKVDHAVIEIKEGFIEELLLYVVKLHFQGVSLRFLLLRM